MTVPGETVQVLRNQIIIWLSINNVRQFPAILDTGHSHNLSIAKRHLDRWSGASLKQCGESNIRTFTVPHFSAEVTLHRNVPGSHALRDSVCLNMEHGIAVIPDDLPVCPRLPILGLRTIIQNKLRLIIDGERATVTLQKRWFLV